MCGFAGVVVWDEKFRVSRETLMGMSARIAHRGPDGEGLYLSPDAPIAPGRPQVGLAHRRLAILDLDPRANQPFTDHLGRRLVFNGEIYNFRELRAELAALKPNYFWRTTGDTEVLLVAYDAWGDKCLDHLNGMFAFAVWDEPTGTLFLARDRMGQKPLYAAAVFADDAKCAERVSRSLFAPLEGACRAIAFASEIPALRSAAWVEDAIDENALGEYLRWGYVPHPLSIYRNVVQVSPGTAHTVSYQGVGKYSYFQPSARFEDGEGAKRYSDADAVARTRDLVMTAARRQLIADVPVGCFLSGGVDSSVVAYAMKAAAAPGQPVLTFSVGFGDKRYDETEYAAAVAAHLGTEHRAFEVRPEAAVDLPRLACAFGEPFADSSALPTYYLARQTRQHVKVALSGDGGDELFGGYDRYRAMLLARRLRMATTPLPWLAARRIFERLAAGHPKSTATRAARFCQSLALAAAQRYASYMRLFPDELMSQLVDGRLGSPPLHDLFEWGFKTAGCGSDGVRAALGVDRATYLPDDLLTKVDRASMRHALEVRSPFMDHELVRFAANLRTRQLLSGGGKRMLREAFASNLPAFVFKRRKMGFAVPIGQWFRDELRPMLRDHLFAASSFASTHFNRDVVQRLVDEHERHRVDHSQRLYALFMLELWWQASGKQT